MGAFDGGAVGRFVDRNGLRAKPRLRGTTRAVRLALALSAAALAMSGSGSAFAATTCAPPAPVAGDDVTCSGAGTLPISFTVEDLTVTTDATVDLLTTTTTAVGLTGTTGTEGFYNLGVINNTGIYSVNVTTGSGAITVGNDNGIFAYGDTIPASTYAIHASSTDGTIVVDNALGAYLTVYNSFGDGFGIYAGSQTANVDVTNDGSIYVSPSGNAYGIYATSDDGVVHATNTGDITANSGSTAYGIYAQSYGNVYVDNSGTVLATSTGAFGGAYGIFAYTCDCAALDATVDNSGSITATTTGIFSDATGIYVYAYGVGDVDITNSGTINANTYGVISDATGVYASLDDGVGSVDNSGSVDVHGYSDAYGLQLVVDADGTASVSNSGTISVDAYLGQATGVFASTDAGGTVNVDNSGSIYVHTDYQYALGVHAYSDGAGDVDVDNSGTVNVVSHYGAASGIMTSSNDGSTLVDNSGSISVATNDAGASILGINAYGYDVAAVYNSGHITVYAQGGGYGTGIMAIAFAGDIIVDNSGTISATSLDDAQGIDVSGNDGDVTVTNTASIVATSLDGDAYGIFVGVYGYGDITIDNDAQVTSSAGTDGSATGIHVGIYYADAVVNNTGTISVTSVDGQTYGIYAYHDLDGDITINNGGLVTLDGAGYAYGVYAYANGDGNLTINNTGTIDAASEAAVAYGVYATTDGLGDVSVNNAGTIVVDASLGAYGIKAYAGVSGSIDIASSGSISATTVDYDATGIHAFSYSADVAVQVSGGSVHAASVNGNATGIHALAANDVSVANAGTVSVDAGNGTAYAIHAHSIGTGSVDVASSGAIFATAYIRAAGIFAQGQGDISVLGSGVIDASAGDFDYSDAFGIFASTLNGDIDVDNDATISVSAGGIGGGAIGIDVNTGTGAVLVANSGDIDASSTYSATAIFAVADQDLEVDNAGSLQVDAGSFASGIVASGGQGNVSVSNTGAISVSGGVAATGVALYSVSSDIAFYNFGDIMAGADDYATGVQLGGVGSTLLFNQGTIGASSATGSAIAVLTGDSVDRIHNHGTINGVVVTGAGDDELYNYADGTWNATGNSDFGDGDDTITNYGLISMSDAVIDLGLPGTDGNAFCNYGTIFVSGDNIIDMEGGSAAALMDAALAAAPGPLASSNPLAFYNYNLIDFQDGSPTDTLTIIGDFGGQGDINLDVSGLNGTGDLLYIDGDVLSDTVQAINVDMVDMPGDGTADVTLVEVGGNSVAGNFVLGSVSYDPIPFISSSFSLVSNINGGNTSPDLFSLRVDMALQPDGEISANLPAGVQLLMNDVVGSWHKRVDGIDDRPGGKFSLWGRLYHNKGKVNPDFDSDTIADGDFDFEQKNYGGEAGFDFAPNGKWNFGLLVGKANADQGLRVGLGTDKIEGNVAGGYGTFRMPRGFYFDLSHRRLNFDAVVHTANGDLRATGEAQASNAESGYSFAFKGFEFEGQLQVTRTRLVSLDNLAAGSGGGSYTPPGGLAKGAAAMAAAAPAQAVEFDNDADISTVTRAGWDVRKKFKTESGTLWELHATMNRIRMVGAQNAFQITDEIGGKTDIGGDSSLLDVGFTARRGLLLMYGAVTWQDGGALQNFFGAQLGAKYTW
jgi:hypothetical protein